MTTGTLREEIEFLAERYKTTAATKKAEIGKIAAGLYASMARDLRRALERERAD